MPEESTKAHDFKCFLAFPVKGSVIMQDDVLGIVIVSYNTADLLGDCLVSLRSCTLPRRIVVVDNASTDGSAEVVRSEFPEVQLIANPDNRGFARATNQGLRALAFPAQREEKDRREEKTLEKEAKVNYVLLLNPDTVVPGGALETMVAFLEAHPRVGAAGPRLLNPDGSIQENAFTFPTLWMSFFDFFPIHGRLYYSRLNGRYPQTLVQEAAPFPIDHPLGACLLLRVEALAGVGLLDEGYFIYVEEVDLCYRIKQAGWEVYHVPAARVLHYGGRSTRQMPERMFVALHRSRHRFFQKHRSAAFRWAHRQITRLGLAGRARQDRRAQRRNQLDSETLARRLAAYREIARMR